MTRIALAAAEQLADAVDAWGMPGLRALLPVAGMSIVEHQAEQARAMGCDAFLLLIDALPAALTEAVDRIRARGLPVQLVRNASDAGRMGLCMCKRGDRGRYQSKTKKDDLPRCSRSFRSFLTAFTKPSSGRRHSWPKCCRLH